ncbi:hypothetical protein H0H92_008529 [Tricholoma furcatifolium]|nr:hypothetical protein H0H92_008529 [Tricholoma furcatifolium]
MPLNNVLRHGTHILASSINSHRILLYTVVSVLAVSVVIANALRDYSNFYSVAISLSKSNRSVLALANFSFLVSLLCGHLVQRLFFGTLRANEVERLYDRLWFFITESLLAFTIFRDEFDIPFAMMFGFLLFVKSFHWLAGDRIEWMDQRPYPGPSPLFHVRMNMLFVILWLTDLFMFLVAVENTLANGVGGMVLFASEYGILMSSLLNTICKYLLSAYELRRAGRRGGENAPPWENKSMWTFYIELATDFLKLTTYLVFFMIIITFYGLPLNIVRDVYITARSFISRLRALHRYQTATRNMDQRYPNATADELAAMSDRTCIICREEMILSEARQQGQAPTASDGPNTTPKKLPCGHIFHFHCLRSWLERQQSCPTCRRTVLDDNPQGQPAAGAFAAGAPAVPRRPNNPPAQNQNRVNNPLGNPLGLVGRLFGPPGQPPIAPGQPLPGQAVNQNNPPQDHVDPAGHQLPQGVVIQYHIQYQPQQPQQQPQQQQQNTPQHPLQQAPQFPGFQGPQGVWQPWVHNIANQEPEAEDAPHDAQTQPFDNTTQPPSTSTNEEPPVNPREAAASAALRRFNANSSGRSSSSPSSIQNAGTASSSSTTSTNMNAGQPSLARVGHIPSLVPLYDYSGISGPTRNSQIQGPSHVSETRSSPELGNSRPVANNNLPHPQITRENSSSSLPPVLTEEQLGVMDRLTREAIDERLRVLEGVSGAIYRCIDDLMRVRSALPISNTDPSISAQVSTPNASVPTADVSTSSSAVKESRLDAPTTTPSGSNGGEGSQSHQFEGGSGTTVHSSTSSSIENNHSGTEV